jgi:hypothetical protein
MHCDRIAISIQDATISQLFDIVLSIDERSIRPCGGGTGTHEHKCSKKVLDLVDVVIHRYYMLLNILRREARIE